jgi:phosphoribosylglycinamide formyltransferase-1
MTDNGINSRIAGLKKSNLFMNFSQSSSGSGGTSHRRVAIFASGAGSNALKIIQHFKNHPTIHISLIACNRPEAGVIKIAENEGIELLMLDKEQFFRGDAYVEDLKARQINFIVLAGFLWKVPALLIRAFAGRIVNIHPALLPRFGGKGMYGEFVHQAVIAAGEKTSGITIHKVDEIYDHGEQLFQISVPLAPDETPKSLAEKIHLLEHEHYPRVIEELIQMSTAG